MQKTATGVGAGITNTDFDIDIVSKSAVIDKDNPVLKNLTPGTYTVQYEMTINKTTYKPYATLTVTDKQTSTRASILNTNAGDRRLSAIMENTDFAKFYYGDVQLQTGEYKYAGADCVINGNGKNVYVKSVTLNVRAASSQNYFQTTVAVNKTFVCDQKWAASGKDFVVGP